MKRRTFKDKSMQAVYERRLSGDLVAKTNGLGSAYSVGLTCPDKPSRFVRTSLAYAAWAAGVDVARNGAKA